MSVFCVAVAVSSYAKKSPRMGGVVIVSLVSIWEILGGCTHHNIQNSEYSHFTLRAPFPSLLIRTMREWQFGLPLIDWIPLVFDDFDDELNVERYR